MCHSVQTHEGHHPDQCQQPFHSLTILSSIRDETLSSQCDRDTLVTLLYLPVTWLFLQTQLGILTSSLWVPSPTSMWVSPPLSPHSLVFTSVTAPVVFYCSVVNTGHAALLTMCWAVFLHLPYLTFLLACSFLVGGNCIFHLCAQVWHIAAICSVLINEWICTINSLLEVTIKYISQIKK